MWVAILTGCLECWGGERGDPGVTELVGIADTADAAKALCLIEEDDETKRNPWWTTEDGSWYIHPRSDYEYAVLKIDRT